ncbi:MAG: hypothetical protein WDM94_00455 [Bauldia sp.]
MLENIISIGSAAIGVGGSAASIYSAVSAIATGKFQNQVLSLLAPKHKVVRLNEHILWAPESAPFVAPGAKQLDPRVMLRSLERAQQILKQDIITSGVLASPDELLRQFNLNPKDCLVGIEPLQTLRSGRSPDWAPVLFSKDGVPYIGWQKVGMLRTILGFEFSGDAEAWIRPQLTVAPAAPPASTPSRLPKLKSSTQGGKKRKPPHRR